MSKNETLSEKWIKASIAGTIWAASEIVLGSFLHNLKIPFSGNVLTAIGIIILISISYIWTEKGLFWRAGLICALMKTMSPSAVIFGPMIAIFSEAAMLEIAVRIFGKTLAGYVIGAMFAMSWNLFQRILNYIIFYGYNIVELYAELIKYAQKQLHINFDIVWLPILILGALYSFFGFAAAVIGIRVGRKMLKQPAERIHLKEVRTNDAQPNKTRLPFNYSMYWLFTDIFLIISSLVILNYSWIFWTSSITAIVILWAFRYNQALRQLSKPKFWIFFIVITMITAFVFTKMQPGAKNLEQGLLIGIQMNFRAVIIIVGFAVLGTELYNPKIRQFFLKTSFQQLPLALELSFESLPGMIANIPDLKTIIKNPVYVIYQIVSQAERRLAEVNRKRTPKVFIISGAVGQGKTTQIKRIIETLQAKKISVGGIYSPKIMEAGRTTGYDVVDIMSNVRAQFLRISNEKGLNKIGRYSIFPGGLQVGSSALMAGKNLPNKIVVIDEVGVLELDNRGWASNIRELLASNSLMLWTVRNTYVEQVIRKWSLREDLVFEISENDYLTIINLIVEQIEPGVS